MNRPPARSSPMMNSSGQSSTASRRSRWQSALPGSTRGGWQSFQRRGVIDISLLESRGARVYFRWGCSVLRRPEAQYIAQHRRGTAYSRFRMLDLRRRSGGVPPGHAEDARCP
eukprot:872454-Alexandrium_andersonii.AAC.1